jgi:hypothetical protein
MTIKPSGNIAIVWGSGGANGGANSITGSICETLTMTPKNAAPIDIENDEGFTAIQVMLRDGFDAKATYVYDSNRSIPAEGANITLVGPKQDGNAGTTNFNCTFWSFGFSRNKKKEKTVEISFTHRPLINGSPA